MEKTRKSLEARLDKLLAADKKDDVITFEQLGVDRLEMPVKKVRMSIASDSESFGFSIITYGSSKPLFCSSEVRFTILISWAISGRVSFQRPRYSDR